MNTASLIKASLTSRCLNSFLSIMLTALGVMLAVIIILFAGHMEDRLGKNAKGIDFVIGAKGSPLQLILSSVYHVDIPTGNIPYDEAQRWIRHKQVKKAIPLALGDSYKGYRIVGTNEDYIKLYKGEIRNGHIWNKPFEAVAGSATGLSVGDVFSGAHGLMEGGHNHDENPYTVTGVLKPTGTVLDRLILTSVDSVLLLHGLEASHDHEHEKEEHHNHDAHEHEENAHHGHEEEHAHHEEGHDHHDHDAGHENEHDHHGHEDHHEENHEHEEAGKPEITALLIQTRSPIAVMNLPRLINRDTNLQAAAPAYEMARLTSMLGLGSKTALALSIILIGIAGLSIFSGMAGALDNRSYDLAVMRALGFSAGRLFRLILAEGLVLVGAGLVIGIVLGHTAFDGLIHTMEPLQTSGANAWHFDLREAGLAVFILLAGIAASLVPAIRAARLDAGALLAKGA